MQLQQLSLAVQRTEAAVRTLARLQQGAVGADIIQPGAMQMLSPAVELCRMVVSTVQDDVGDGDVIVGVQLVLQSAMSLLLTLLSTGQSKPGAAVPVLAAIVDLQGALVKHDAAVPAAAPGAAAAAAAESQAVAAGWLLLGCCMLQLSEQLHLCATQPDSYPLSGWLLTSAKVRDQMRFGPCGTTVVTREHLQGQLKHLIVLLTLVLTTVQCGYDAVLLRSMQQPVVSSSSSSWGTSYRSQLVKAREAMLDMVHPALAALGQPQALAELVDVICQEIASQQQQQQQQRRRRHNSPAVKQALLDMSAGLSRAGAALCAALPNRYFCNNQGCRNAAGVSAGFGLVRGKACVCGGCVGAEGAAGAAVAPQGAVAAR